MGPALAGLSPPQRKHEPLEAKLEKPQSGQGQSPSRGGGGPRSSPPSSNLLGCLRSPNDDDEEDLGSPGTTRTSAARGVPQEKQESRRAKLSFPHELQNRSPGEGTRRSRCSNLSPPPRSPLSPKLFLSLP